MPILLLEITITKYSVCKRLNFSSAISCEILNVIYIKLYAWIYQKIKLKHTDKTYLDT